jgi:hypothetical protein
MALSDPRCALDLTYRPRGGSADPLFVSSLKLFAGWLKLFVGWLKRSGANTPVR